LNPKIYHLEELPSYLTPSQQGDRRRQKVHELHSCKPNA